jgi:hypothetical protein
MLRLQKTGLMSLLAGFLMWMSVGSTQAFDTLIQISPNVLNIGSSGEVVTVHTDLPYAQVVVYSVFLNGVPIASWKADDQGNFVAKFDIQAIKTLNGLVIGGDNQMILTGATTSGDSFVGIDWVRVVNVIPRKR